MSICNPIIQHLLNFNKSHKIEFTYFWKLRKEPVGLPNQFYFQPIFAYSYFIEKFLNWLQKFPSFSHFLETSCTGTTKRRKRLGLLKLKADMRALGLYWDVTNTLMSRKTMRTQILRQFWCLNFGYGVLKCELYKQLACNWDGRVWVSALYS